MHFISLLPILALNMQTVTSWPNLSLRQTASNQITVDLTKKYQIVDGWGFSQAFQRANWIKSLSTSTRTQVLDLLFSPIKGLGMNILRNGIGGSPNGTGDHMLSIIPGPWDLTINATNYVPNYKWDGNDGGQVWLSQQAKSYGVTMFFASAWSAPGFMKTNGIETNGGTLCGTTNSKCATGDWRQVYADFLVQYIKYYEQEGIDITHLGFLNEPDLTEPYASMRSNGQQAADFIKVLHPTIQAASLSTKITCCDGSGYNAESAMTSGLRSVDSLLDIRAVHPYSSALNAVLSPLHPIWQAEYSDQKSSWNPLWYNTSSSSGSKGDGLTWANNIQTAFTKGNVSAYIYWIGAEYGNVNTMLVRLNGNSVQIPKRYWAFAQFSRFVRPGAVRVSTTSTNSRLATSAFVNENGTVAVQVINQGTVDVNVTLKGAAGTAAVGRGVAAWLSNEAHDLDLTPADIDLVGDGVINGTVPARSFVSFII